MRLKANVVFVIVSLTALFSLYIALESGKVIYNATPSYPTGFYLVEQSEVYGKNDLVLICPENNTLFEKNNFGFVQQDDRYCSKYQPLIKKIVGVAGDQVS
ncbi:MAG: S26 family signal peptidase, partial [Sulfurovum sp.]|nr:S26 family signal peptidase [Sulfurovum sp.]